MYSLYTKWKRMSSLAARALSAGSDLVPRPDQVAAMRVFVDVVYDGVVSEELRRRQIEVVAAGARLLCRGDGFVHPADERSLASMIALPIAGPWLGTMRST